MQNWTIIPLWKARTQTTCSTRMSPMMIRPQMMSTTTAAMRMPTRLNLKKKKEKTNWTRHWKASEKTTRCLTTIQTDTTTRTALTTKKWFTATLPLSMIS